MNSGTEDTAVDPITRLDHYKKESRYPPDSRPAQIPVDLSAIPLIDGNASSDAAITGFDGESIEHGSLHIKFKVLIQKGGRYSFKTVVSNENGKSLALCTITQDLAAGSHTLAFRLYGLIVRDANASAAGSTMIGPFRLPGITGERLPTDQELQDFAEGKISKPPQGALKIFSKEYRSQKYAMNAFTDREWDSLAKQQRIRELEEEIKQYKANPP